MISLRTISKLKIVKNIDKHFCHYAYNYNFLKNIN
jgi:hypothetical protein